MVFIRYIDEAFSKDEIKEATSFFQSLNSKGDTLISQNTLSALNKFSDLMVDDTLKRPIYDYYFSNDTIRVNNQMSSYIYIPRTREKFSSNLYLNGEREYEVSKIFSVYRTKTKINIFKNKTKKILGLDCHLIEIIKTQKIGELEEDKIFNVYISDKVSIPFHHYDIINLSEPNKIKGLIMEIEIRNEKGVILNHYLAQKYELLKQNSDLINIESLKDI